MIPHGRSRYTGHGCRCEICCKANREYLARRKAERLAYVAANGLPGSVEHGPSAYQNWGCRCDQCRAAWSKYIAQQRKARAWA